MGRRRTPPKTATRSVADSTFHLRKPKPATRYHCQVCLLPFGSIGSLNAHHRGTPEHAPDPKVSITPENTSDSMYVECKECGKKGMRSLSVHLATMHRFSPYRYLQKYPGSFVFGRGFKSGPMVKREKVAGWKARVRREAADLTREALGEPILPEEA